MLIASNTNPLEAAQILSSLKYAGLFAEADASRYRDIIINTSNLSLLKTQIEILEEYRLFTPIHAEKSLNALINHSNPRDITKILIRLRNIGFKLTEFSFEKIIRFPNTKLLYWAINELYLYQGDNFFPQTTHILEGNEGVLNFFVLLESTYTLEIVFALEALYIAGFLSGKSAQAYRNALTDHQNPTGLAHAFIELQRAKLLGTNEKNRDFVTNAPLYIERILHHMRMSNLLNQNNLEGLAVIAPLLEDLKFNALWCSLSTHLFSQKHFNTLLWVSKQADKSIDDKLAQSKAYLIQTFFKKPNASANQTNFANPSKFFQPTTHNQQEAKTNKMVHTL